MTKPDHQKVVDVLKARDGQASQVRLADGREFVVYNIAWGYDLGNEVAHITTNISPEPAVSHTCDFFAADEVVEIRDLEDDYSVFALGTERGVDE